MRYYLNALSINLSSDEFWGVVIESPHPTEFRAIDKEHGDRWLLLWDGGKAYGVPRTTEQQLPLGSPVLLDATKHLGARILRARLAGQIQRLFGGDEIKLPKRKPYSFVARKEELIEELLANWKNPPALARKFKIRPSFSFDPRLVEFTDGALQIILVIGVKMEWQITARIPELVESGIDLRGLYTVWRNPQPGISPLVGKIESITNGVAKFSESRNGIEELPLEEISLEPSTASFSRALGSLLGRKYDSLLKDRFKLEGEYLTGRGNGIALKKWAEFFTSKTVQLTPEIECSFGNLIRLDNIGGAIRNSPPVQHCYDPARTKRHPFAWEGLVENGPYSSDSLGIRRPKILVVVPASLEGRADQFLAKFLRGISGAASKGYKDGFTKVFGMLAPDATKLIVADDRLRDDPAGSYVERLRAHFSESQNADHDLAMVFLKDAHSELPIPRNPYYRSKSFLLNHGVPDQQVREVTLSQSDLNLNFTLRNIAIASYAKIGGTPWTIDHDQTYDHEVVIGMGSCELSESRFVERQRFVGITTVFRGNGDYLLSNVSRECSYEDYPQTLLEAVRSALDETKRRNGWQIGDNVKVVLHAYKPLKNLEIDAFMREAISAVSGEQNVKFAFVEVNEHHPFRIFSTEQRDPDHRSFVPERGTIARLGSHTRLVSVRGPAQLRRADSPLPAPLLVHIHPSSTYQDLDYLSEQILKFTSLSWRSTLPGRMPVTIRYSQLIAKLLSELRGVPNWSTDVLDTRLKAKRWFL